MVFFIKKSLDRNNKSPEIGEITNDDNTTTNCGMDNQETISTKMMNNMDPP
jgi:hypothetical protein